MWRELVQRLTTDCEFASPASEPRVAQAEAKLQVSFPEDLRNLLFETNGVLGEYGLGLVWPIERIEKENLAFRSASSFRELYMPFDCLLFFADAGNGDQFAFPILDGEIRRKDIFAWDHETDSRTWVAPSLERYLEWWLSGQIKL